MENGRPRRLIVTDGHFLERCRHSDDLLLVLTGLIGIVSGLLSFRHPQA
jgi:hypothetical protein